MASPAELSLVTQTQNPFEEQADQTQKIQDFLARLEEERLKIEAFKRELPLCMQLLNNAMEAYKLQLETHQKREEPRAVLEEFMPLKIEEHEMPSPEKASWMVSAQLWSAAVPITEAEENSFALSSKLALDSNPRSGGAFHPFSKEKRKDLPPSPGSNCSSAISALPELALGPVDNEMGVKKTSEIEQNGVRCSKSGGSDQQQNASGEVGPSAQRKARRCWSPDLHRRFVNALQTLGGSQVATPKQIRELMKVDGLTNDEVKSHLQKYRLHTRRPMPAQAPAPAPAPHLVVLGGIWVPTEYATSAAAAGSALCAGAHPVPPHYCPPPPVAQDYYQITAPTPLAASQFNTYLPPLHREGSGAALALYKGREASPESELRSFREQSESVEEEEDDEEEAEEQNATLVLAGAKPSEDVALKF